VSAQEDIRPSLLIVDDDEPFRVRLTRALSHRGYEVRAAAHYEAAMDLARADSPQYAIVDLKMPGRSGLELVRDLRALDPTTKIVVLTGYASVTTAVESMRIGATHYLPKPADADEIIAALAKVDEASELTTTAITAPSLARAEWEHIQRILGDTGGNISEAARRLGLHRRTLQLKLRKNPPAK
jgi:two-component system response regulator RegA